MEGDTNMKTFSGHRQTKDGDLNVNVLDEGSVMPRVLPLRTNEVNHSPTGFECGYCGAGPHQLAYSMLREVGYDKKHAETVCHGVVLGIVCKLPREGTWTVEESVILEVVETYRKSIVCEKLFE
jgi:hypothetical protein